ncbi:MAG TPA: hypothetical protein VIU61_13110 [Kofleriaceae bacterium]
MSRFALSLALLTSCIWTEPSPVAPNDKPVVTTVPPPITAPAAGTVTVDLTAVTLADDCGGTPPWGPPAAPAPKAERERKADSDEPDKSLTHKSKAKRRCEQTSMQLSLSAAAGGAPTKITVKKVEMFDESGTSLGQLAASTPTYWSANGQYEAWDQMIAPATQRSVSYVLARPDWDRIQNRWNRTFTLKVTVTIGNADQALTKDVQTISAPTTLPPNVKT